MTFLQLKNYNSYRRWWEAYCAINHQRGRVLQEFSSPVHPADEQWLNVPTYLRNQNERSSRITNGQ